MAGNGKKEWEAPYNVRLLPYKLVTALCHPDELWNESEKSDAREPQKHR